MTQNIITIRKEENRDLLFYRTSAVFHRNGNTVKKRTFLPFTKTDSKGIYPFLCRRRVGIRYPCSSSCIRAKAAVSCYTFDFGSSLLESKPKMDSSTEGGLCFYPFPGGPGDLYRRLVQNRLHAPQKQTSGRGKQFMHCLLYKRIRRNCLHSKILPKSRHSCYFSSGFAFSFRAAKPFPLT